MLYTLIDLKTSKVRSFESDQMIIGRGPNSDLRLMDKSISRAHCEIKEDGHSLIVKDLNSLTGVFVNGERVVDQQKLESADQLRIGECLFEVSFNVDQDDGVSETQILESTETALFNSESLPQNSTIVSTKPSEVMPRCTLISTDETSISLKFDGESAIIGRSPNSNTRLHHPSISLSHAKVFIKNKHYYLSDLSSTNGSELNGKRIRANKESKIVSGDKIKLGDELFTIALPNAIEDTNNKRLWVRQFSFFVLANAVIIAWALWRLL